MVSIWQHMRWRVERDKIWTDVGLRGHRLSLLLCVECWPVCPQWLDCISCYYLSYNECRRGECPPVSQCNVSCHICRLLINRRAIKLISFILRLLPSTLRGNGWLGGRAGSLFNYKNITIIFAAGRIPQTTWGGEMSPGLPGVISSTEKEKTVWRYRGNTFFSSPFSL